METTNCSHKDFPYICKDLNNWKPAGYKNKVYRNILHVIGNTPLVQLNRIPKDYGLECEIYAKCEFLNPGGSIKDRVSYTMMVDAENRGLTKNGVTRFIEPTSGNTGIGVSLATAVHGYKCTIVTPDKNSDEKVNTIKLLGADVIQTPSSVSHEDPRSFVSVCDRMREADPDAVTMDQYSNNVNPMTHYEFTAEEILLALGTVDMVVLGGGTGGTISGIAHKIKSRCPECIVVAVDPKGSTIFGDSPFKLFKVEGIGGDFIPFVLDKTVVDRVEAPNDYESFNMAREVIRKEGLLCGGSSGATMFAAVKAAKALNLGAGKRVVVMLADGIRNYMTKFVTDQWMEANLFKEPPNYDHIKWWNNPISALKINTYVPRLYEENSCSDALLAMGSSHSMVIVVSKAGFFSGAVSKDSLRRKATNPTTKDETLNFDDPLSLHLIRDCYKIIENEKNPTVGLISRILDIAPFVVIVEKTMDCNLNDQEAYIPKGIITTDIVMEHIQKYQH